MFICTHHTTTYFTPIIQISGNISVTVPVCKQNFSDKIGKKPAVRVYEAFSAQGYGRMAPDRGLTDTVYSRWTSVFGQGTPQTGATRVNCEVCEPIVVACVLFISGYLLCRKACLSQSRIWLLSYRLRSPNDNKGNKTTKIACTTSSDVLTHRNSFWSGQWRTDGMVTPL